MQLRDASADPTPPPPGGAAQGPCWRSAALSAWSPPLRDSALVSILPGLDAVEDLFGAPRSASSDDAS